MGSSTTIFDFSGTDLVFRKKKFHGIVPQRYGLQAHLLSKIVRCGASQKYPTWDST